MPKKIVEGDDALALQEELSDIRVFPILNLKIHLIQLIRLTKKFNQKDFCKI